MRFVPAIYCERCHLRIAPYESFVQMCRWFFHLSCWNEYRQIQDRPTIVDVHIR